MQTKYKLNAAFNNLRKQGFIARQNFSCCSSCAGYELASYVKELSPAKQAKVKGAITYTRQDGQDAFEDRSRRWPYHNRGPRTLLIGYGPIGVHGVGDFGLPTAEVGQALKAALEAEGLQVDWDGDPDKRIAVTVG